MRHIYSDLFAVGGGFLQPTLRVDSLIIGKRIDSKNEYRRLKAMELDLFREDSGLCRMSAVGLSCLKT